MLLNGDWKATDSYGSSLEFTRLDYDDSGWETMPVPGHWQQHPAFAEYPEKLLYRRRFKCAAPAAGRRFFLRFEGVFYFARVWMNGAYLGEHTGYFEPFEFEATAAVHDGENVLAVFVRCEREKLVDDKDQVLGVFGHWDCMPKGIYPGGIWADVSAIERPAVHISELRVGDFTVEQHSSEAVFRATAVISGLIPDVPHRLSIKWKLSPHNFDGDALEGEILLDTLTHEDPEASFDIAVQSPRLWWTWDRGLQNLYNLKVTLMSPESAEIDISSARFGIRTVELRDWIFYLNGKRLFCRGSNYAPGDARLASMNRARCAGDVRLARDANMNMLRVHAHVDRPEFYDLCDENGILVWQDLPLQWYYAREVEPEAVRQMRAMMRLLGNHPCIVLWCCHNEPFKEVEAANLSTLLINTDNIKKLFAPGSVMFGHNWNRNELDAAIKRAADEVDTSRPVIPHSGIPGMLGEGTDAHFYFGWYMGTMRGLAPLLKIHRRLFKFVTEYGAQAFPNVETFRLIQDAATVAELDWDKLEKHCLQKRLMDKFAPPHENATLEEYIAVTQWYQARVIRYHNELLRRYKYDPCGGAVHFLFNDCAPAITWAVADSRRGLKQGYAALRDSFRQLLPVADFPKRWYPRGDLITLRLHVINDHETHFPGAALKWAISDSAGEDIVSGQETIDIEADWVQRAGRARWDSGNAPAGGYALVLELSGPAISTPVVNQYEFELRK